MGFLSKLILGDHSDVGMGNKPFRDAWLEKTLNAIPAGRKLLDAGAGEQQFRKYCTHLEYVSQDFAQYDGSGDGKGIQTEKWDTARLDIISDIRSIPVPDSSFDVVLCTEVLEHVPYPAEAIREMIRVLKKGGLLILTAPFGSLTHFAPYHFSTGFNSYFYEYWMKEYACKIKELSPNGNYFEWIAQELRYATVASEKYKGPAMGFLEKISQRRLLSWLKRNSRQASKSHELACFGYHMIAEKL